MDLNFHQSWSQRAGVRIPRGRKRKRERKGKQQQQHQPGGGGGRRARVREKENDKLLLRSQKHHSQPSFFLLSCCSFSLLCVFFLSPFFAPCSARLSPRSRRAVCAFRPFPRCPGALRRVSSHRRASFNFHYSRHIPSPFFTSAVLDRMCASPRQSKPCRRPCHVYGMA